MLVRNACVRDARVRREASALAEDGHRVVVIATMEPGVAREEETDGFLIRRIDPVPVLIERLAGRPANPPSVGRDGRGSPPARRSATLYAIRDRLVTQQFRRAVRRTPADVYHAHDANTLEAAAHGAARHRATLVYDAHELYSELTGLIPRERARWRALERRLVGRARRVITVSDSLADELVDRYGIERPLVVMNIPEKRPLIDPSRSPLAAVRAEGRLLVVYSGGISANRGLEALAQASARAHGWELVLLGWGPLRAELETLFPNVTFLDPVPVESLIEAVAGADVGVIPYVPVGLNNALSLPNKLFEYIHAGLAVAASDLVELRRFVDGRGVGLLFAPGDAASIAEVLDRFAADPTFLAEVRARARSAASDFSWDQEKQKLTGLYRSL
ncbi:MAG: glycosyltransferase [Actinomycetota bacterium]